MMKLQTTLVTGIAAFFVAPGLLQDQEELKALESGLADTERSLVILQRFESRSETDANNLPLLILAATEPAQMSATGLMDRLGSLRQEVSLLRMEVDAIESQESSAGTSAVPAHDPLRGNSSTRRRLATPEPVPAMSTGLNDALRMRMQSRLESKQTMEEPVHKSMEDGGSMVPFGRPTPMHNAQEPRMHHAGDTPPVAIDFEGYSADPMGQAQACYRAGRYADSLALLEGLKDTPANHLRSRSLTRLERYDEAVKNLMLIIESTGDSYEGKRAKTDLEFVKWKRDFAKKLPKSAESKSGN